jgi:hypothetical protein
MVMQQGRCTKLGSGQTGEQMLHRQHLVLELAGTDSAQGLSKGQSSDDKEKQKPARNSDQNSMVVSIDA